MRVAFLGGAVALAAALMVGGGSALAAPKGMAAIPGGQLQVGSTDADLDRMAELYGTCDTGQPRALCNYRGWWEFEQPTHRVQIRPFLLGVREVTVRRWRRFIRATGYVTTAERCDPCAYWYGEEGWVRPSEIYNWRLPAPGWRPAPDEPVVQVSIADARAFMRWRSKRDGVRYRLPTMRELEWAAWGDGALAGRSDRPLFPFAASELAANANFGDASSGFPWASGLDDGRPGVAPVGTYPANGYGLFDALGNVWEWTRSRHRRYGRPVGGRRSALRELRGGGFTARPGWMRPQTRMYHPAGDSAYDIGFRIAADRR